QRDGDGRGARIPHAGVTNERQVALQLGGIILDEVEQVNRAAFFLTLDHQRQRQWQGPRHFLEGPASLDEGHQLPFVVARPSRNDYLSAIRGGRNSRRERGRLPKIERVHWLHVIVAIEENARSIVLTDGATWGRRFGQNHRMAVGRTYIDVETDP